MLAAQISACEGLAEGDACRYPGAPEAACFAGVCQAVGCGNAVVEPGEACDDGNTVDDGCSAICELER